MVPSRGAPKATAASLGPASFPQGSFGAGVGGARVDSSPLSGAVIRPETKVQVIGQEPPEGILPSWSVSVEITPLVLTECYP